jgi:carbamoyl-phosphate synthase large subunit
MSKMRSPIPILVTAAEGDLGQAIIKALRLAPFPVHIIGLDHQPGGGARAFCDQVHAIPLAENTSYLEKLRKIAEQTKARAIIPASEAEMRVLSKLSSFPALSSNGTKIICQPAEIWECLGNKLTCYRRLEGVVPLAPFADAENEREIAALVKAHGFPLVLKPATGRGSKGFALLRHSAELEAALQEREGPCVLQGFLDDAGGEYTVSVFRDLSGLRSVTFRRELEAHGCSWRGELINDGEIAEYCECICKTLAFQHSLNLQVRKTSKGVRLLEINPRFSSIAAMRAAAGFNDVAWSVAAALNIPIEKGSVTSGPFRFWRFVHEIIETPNGFLVHPDWQPRGGPLY